MPHSLSGSPEILALRTCILLVAAGAVGDWTNCTLAGALQGAGKQNLGAAIYAGTHWILGTTLLYVFGFRLGWGVRGIWAALAVVSNVQCLFMSVRATCQAPQAPLCVAAYCVLNSPHTRLRCARSHGPPTRVCGVCCGQGPLRGSLYF